MSNKTETFTLRNDGGRDYRTVIVHWKPENVTWADPAFENVGETIWAWKDDCPLMAQPNPFGGEDLVPIPVSVNGQVFEPTEVEKLSHLTQGTFFIEEN